MSTTDNPAAAAEDAARTATMVHREFLAELTAGDGRTVDVRVVPYGVAADVSDGGPVYREEWVAGCFDDQLRAANRVDVLLNFEHQQGISGLVGRGTHLRSEQDGFYATFRMFNGSDGEKALELVGDGILGGVSLEAYPKKSVRGADGVVRRIKAHLDKVALCRRPAFKDAIVLAVREQPETVFDEELLPVDLNPDLVERCRRLGIKLPQRYEAHPATGTPAEAGTPADGTRQETNPDDTEVSAR